MKKTGWITFAAAAAASLLLLAAGCGNAAGGGEGGGDPLPENGTIMLESNVNADETGYLISVGRFVDSEEESISLVFQAMDSAGDLLFVIGRIKHPDGRSEGVVGLEFSGKNYDPKYDTIVIKGQGSAKITAQGNPNTVDYDYRNDAIISLDQIREISEFGSITVEIAAPPDGEATGTFQLPATFASYIKQYLL